jgi:hypothetical protein
MVHEGQSGYLSIGSGARRCLFQRVYRVAAFTKRHLTLFLAFNNIRPRTGNMATTNRVLNWIKTRNLNELVHNVIWPAVAGNILWAFLQVAVGPKTTETPAVADGSYYFNLVSLFLIGIYLAIDWVNTANVKKMNDHYWMFDIPIAAALATFAVFRQFGTQTDILWSNWVLLFAFSIAAIGHVNGAWDPAGKASPESARRWFAEFNGVGAVLLIVGKFIPDAISLWFTPAALFSTLFLYLTFRKRIETKWPAV